MINLRTQSIIDSLQPQLAAYMATVSQGFLPVPGDDAYGSRFRPAWQSTVSPDIALKPPACTWPSRSWSCLRIHGGASSRPEDVREAGRVVLGQHRCQPVRPEGKVPHCPAGDHPWHDARPHSADQLAGPAWFPMILPGQSMFILETEPAGYVVCRQPGRKRPRI